MIAELNHTPRPKSALKPLVSPTSPPYAGWDGEGGRTPAEESFSRQGGERKSFRQRMSKAFSRWVVRAGAISRDRAVLTGGGAVLRGGGAVLTGGGAVLTGGLC